MKVKNCKGGELDPLGNSTLILDIGIVLRRDAGRFKVLGDGEMWSEKGVVAFANSTRVHGTTHHTTLCISPKIDYI